MIISLTMVINDIHKSKCPPIVF